MDKKHCLTATEYAGHIGCTRASIHNYIKAGIIPHEALIPHIDQRFLIDPEIADPAMKAAGKPTYPGDRGLDEGFRKRQKKPYIYQDQKVVMVGTPMHPDMKLKMETVATEKGISIAELNRQILEQALWPDFSGEEEEE